MQKLAYYVAHLLSPNFQKGITVGEAMRWIMGSDRQEDIENIRKKRIARMFEDAD